MLSAELGIGLHWCHNLSLLTSVLANVVNIIVISIYIVSFCVDLRLYGMYTVQNVSKLVTENLYQNTTIFFQQIPFQHKQ